MKKSFLSLVAILILASLLIMPQAALTGARNGLLLWADVIVPTLMPFLVCSSLVVAMDGVSMLTSPLRPLWRLMGLTENGSYTFVCGLLCGYPMGAKTASDFMNRDVMCPCEGKYLLAVCNLASPMFLIGYVLPRIPSETPRWLFAACIYLPIGILALVAGKCYGIKREKPCFSREAHTALSQQGVSGADGLSLDSILMDSFDVMTRIGGYLMLFSIIAEFVRKLPLYPMWKAALLGALEITTGINAIASNTFGTCRTLLLLACTAFGGICGIAQTRSVLAGQRKNAGLSIRHYILWKIAHSFLSCLSYLLLAALALPAH